MERVAREKSDPLSRSMGGPPCLNRKTVSKPWSLWFNPEFYCPMEISDAATAKPLGTEIDNQLAPVGQAMPSEPSSVHDRQSLF